jgi:hypothetical protein
MTIIILIISGNVMLEVFSVMILIGILILRELIDTFAPNDLKDRMNFFIYTGTIIFFGIVIRKIILMLE